MHLVEIVQKQEDCRQEVGPEVENRSGRLEGWSGRLEEWRRIVRWCLVGWCLVLAAGSRVGEIARVQCCCWCWGGPQNRGGKVGSWRAARRWGGDDGMDVQAGDPGERKRHQAGLRVADAEEESVKSRDGDTDERRGDKHDGLNEVVMRRFGKKEEEGLDEKK